MIPVTSSAPIQIERLLRTLCGRVQRDRGDATPGNIYDRLASMSRDQGSALQRTWASLPADARRAVTATMVDSLGRATPGAQNGEGTRFSSNTFLTNWNKLSPDGKNTLFSGFPEAARLRANMDDVAAAAQSINANVKAYTNPSQTAKVSAAQALGGAVFAGLMGNLPIAAAGALTVGGGWGTAKLMTSPYFVNWLAQAPKLPAAALNGQVARWPTGRKRRKTHS